LAQALRDGRRKYPTEVLAAAVKQRKLMASTNPDDQEFPVVVV
jgi:hypothetical protein